MKITRRPATEQDTAFAQDAHHKGYHDTVVRQFGSWDDKAQEEYFYAEWNEEGVEILLCDGHPCGYIDVKEQQDCVALRQFVIHPDYQGKGIGSLVLQEIIEKAKTLGLPTKLGVLKKNDAFNLYSKMGFVEYDTTDTHILMEHTVTSQPRPSLG